MSHKRSTNRSAVTMEELEDVFYDNPSIGASMNDCEHRNSEPPTSPHSFGYPSHHSGFRSDSSSDLGMSASAGRFSPPAWRRDPAESKNGFLSSLGRGLGKRHFDSRDSSPEYESAEDGDDTLAMAARTRLPSGSLSPEKQRSPSPAPYHATPAPFAPIATTAFDGTFIKQEHEQTETPHEDSNNYIRFQLKAELQHRTQPYEDAIRAVSGRLARITRSKTSMAVSALIAFLSVLLYRTIFMAPISAPVPDLVKVAGLAKAFEPLIYYSENGAYQIDDLHQTGVAVWDLGESIRSTNMTSGPIIAQELDELSESLKQLAVSLTTFFANVDGDVDAILIVMDWSRLELAQIQSSHPSAITAAFDNMHDFLSRTGLLENGSGDPTRLGVFTTRVFGLTNPQQTRQTLQRTFTEFLNILEESINSELKHSLALFALFEAIDKQFHNLARTVVRELSAQEAAQEDMLSSLWTKILGANASTLQKFERNKKHLANIRAKTLMNKSVLMEHNGKLLALKANLESLRRKLISPLVRANGSSLTIEAQIRGLEEVSSYLGAVRQKQKGNRMAMLYGAGVKSARNRIRAGNADDDDEGYEY